MFVYKTPLQGNHQHSAKSRSSQDGARLCYIGSHQKMQLCSSGFASLVTRCCFCAGDTEQLIKRNHKQTNRQRLSVISEHFNTVFLFLTSLSAWVSSCAFVLLWVVWCEFERCSCAESSARHRLGSLIDLSIQKWWGIKKTWHICYLGCCFFWSCGVFFQRFPGKGDVSSCLCPSHQGTKSVCGKDETTEQMNKSVSGSEEEWHRINPFPL